MGAYYTYPKFLQSILNSLTVKVLLLTSSAAYDAANEFVANLSNEVTGGSYARQPVAGTITVDANGAYFTPSGSVTFSGITATVQFVVFYTDTGSDATSRLLGITDIGAQALTARSLKLTFSGALLEAV
jgi:hypothetical protein